MHQPLGVGVGDAGEDAEEDLLDLVQRELALGEEVVEAAAADELHHDARRPVDHEGVGHRDDVRVFEPRLDLALGEQALPDLGAGHVQDLQRVQAVEGLVAHDQDRAHAAAREGALDQVPVVDDGSGLDHAAVLRGGCFVG